jgi:hypothetical protein
VFNIIIKSIAKSADLEGKSGVPEKGLADASQIINKMEYSE